jgi:hypothetical protein
MPTPSLILVPARFKTGKLYTPVATTSGGLVLGASGDFNVTRATTATRVNANGLIESVASGVPRLDYYTSGGTAGCPALLVEPSAQNLALRSEQFEVSGTWIAEDITITTGSTAAFIAPDGTTNARLFTATISGFTAIRQNLTIASGTYTISVFAKADTYGLFRIANVSSLSRAAWFDLNTGTVTGTVNGGTASMQNYGNGWYRCSFTSTGILSGSPTFLLAPSDAPNGTNSVSGATMYFWGAQFETGSVATSYIPTTAAPVTRNADVVNLSGAVSGCIGQTQGTIYAEVDYRNLGAAVSIITLQTASYVTGAVRVDTNTLNQIRVQIRDASAVNCLDATFTSTSLSTGINKIAVGYSSNASGVVFALNGSIVATTTVSASFGTLGANRVYLGTRETSASNDLFFNNRIRAAALYTTRLSDPELQTLTQL